MSDIIDAIKNRTTLAFDYDGKQRIIEPHAYGHSTKDGSEVVRGYQVAGEASSPLPRWGLFTVAKMEGLTPSLSPSEAPAPGYRMGDKQMSKIIAQVELADA